MSANQTRCFFSRPLLHAIRTGWALAAAGQLIGVSVAAIPRPDAAVAGKRPLAFEANRGQTDDEVKFLARGGRYTAFFTATEMVLTLDDGRPGRAIVRLKPVGANPAPHLLGDGVLPSVASHERGDRSKRSITAPTYRGVRYVDVYPGIDLVYYGNRQRLEYDFVVAPGASPDQIALTLDGVERKEVDAGGDLVAHTTAGELRQPRPVVYQEIDGARRPVTGDYVVDDDGRVRFRLGAYDTSRPLVIDPVLVYSTYLGGAGDDADTAFSGVVDVAVDGAGNVYVTGTTPSADFPTTPGANQTPGGRLDVFVTKFSPTGALLYSTYLGGPCDDYAREIAVDTAGNAYITGRAHGGGNCYADVRSGVLVAKLDPTGAVLYASVIGGRLADSSIGHAIAVDAAGHAYVTGTAYAASRDFPTTPGALRTGDCGGLYIFNDAFVAKLSADGGALEYSTFLCGTGDDSPSGIAVDAAGNAYVAGTTGSSDFPTVNPLQGSRLGGPVALTGFVSKLSPDGSSLLYSTYLGGSGSDAIGGIALDGLGNVYVTGETASEDFPTTAGVLQERSGSRLCSFGCTDAFVTKLDASGSALVYSTYLFGELDDGGYGIAVDGAGNAYVVGVTNSAYFPIRDAFQSSNRGTDAFVAKLSPDGTRLVYGSYLGGSRMGRSPRTGWDHGSGIAVDATGKAYVAGYTQSYDFPTTAAAFQPTLGGGVCDVFGTACGDAFVTTLTAGGPGVVPPVSLTVTPTEVAPGGTLTATWAGIPAPTASDDLRLHALGTSDSYPGEVAAWWQTTGTAGGNLSLTLPAGLAMGWYELRLLSPDPNFSNLLAVIARSEPILLGAATTTTTPTPVPTTSTLPPITGCEAAGPSVCNDGDPCTADACVAGRGCVSTPASDFASITCTCTRVGPAACTGQPIPASIGGLRNRACSLFDEAAGTTDRARSLKRLRRAVKNLKNSMTAVARAQKRGMSSDCAGALRAELRDTKERAEGLLATLRRPRP